MRAEVLETVFLPSAGAPRGETSFSVVEGLPLHPGQPTRYRLEYLAPANRAGVVLLNDGVNLWRYDPHSRVAARRASVSLAPMPPELEQGVASMPAQSDGARPEIESQTERVADRATIVLALRRPVSGRMLERRWIDATTGRTLRLEQYTGRDARLARRVEITYLDYLTTPAAIADAARRLTPDFPTGTVLADHRSPRARNLANAETDAHRLHLPLHVRGFVLRSADSAPYTSTGSNAATTTHLLYSGSGGQYISVFVSPLTSDNSLASSSNRRSAAIPLQGGADWKPATLDGNRAAFTQETAHGSAVAWTDAVSGYCIAVSHLPLSHLLPVAAAFAADRDDAPASHDFSTNIPATVNSGN